MWFPADVPEAVVTFTMVQLLKAAVVVPTVNVAIELVHSGSFTGQCGGRFVFFRCGHD